MLRAKILRVTVPGDLPVSSGTLPLERRILTGPSPKTTQDLSTTQGCDADRVQGLSHKRARVLTAVGCTLGSLLPKLPSLCTVHVFRLPCRMLLRISIRARCLIRMLMLHTNAITILHLGYPPTTTRILDHSVAKTSMFETLRP